MRVYKNRWFEKCTRRERMADPSLREAIERAGAGLIDADLGVGLIKQRVARAGQGRSGRYRTIAIFQSNEWAIFVFGFAKNGLANISAGDWLSCGGEAHIKPYAERIGSRGREWKA